MKHPSQAVSAPDLTTRLSIMTCIGSMLTQHREELAVLSAIPDPLSRIRQIVAASSRFHERIGAVLRNPAESYRAWRDELLAPFVSALANLVIADLTRNGKR